MGYDTIGTKAMGYDLNTLWMKLDNDGSGRVDIIEFRTFAERHMRNRGLPKRLSVLAGVFGDDSSMFIGKLCKSIEKLLLTKKSSFAIEDLMRLVWPSATAPEIKTMKNWCLEDRNQKVRSRLKPPPVLPKAEYDGLVSVYHLYCRGQEDAELLHIDECVRHGVIFPEEKQEWLKTRSAKLSILDFCEILCPAGYRASAQSTVGCLSDGRRVKLDAQLGCWCLVDVPSDEATDLS